MTEALLQMVQRPGHTKNFEQKYLESLEMWCWSKMEKIKWLEKVTNEEVLERIEETRTILNNSLRRKPN